MAKKKFSLGTKKPKPKVEEPQKPKVKSAFKPKIKLRKKAKGPADTVSQVKKGGRGNRGTIQVTLGYNSVGLDQADMLMEVVSSRGIIPADWDAERWSQWLHTTGAIPFYILCGDIDRYHMTIYAAEYLRKLGPEAKNLRIKDLPKDPTQDITKEQPALDGTTWGSVDGEPVQGDFGISHTNKPTVRDQIRQKEKEHIEKNKPVSDPALLNERTDPKLYRWKQAQRVARKIPRKEWEGKLDYYFEMMVKHCYRWLQETGKVPEPYPDSKDLFWAASKVKQETDAQKERRQYMSHKIMNFWKHSVDKHEGEPIDLKSESYRVTLAAFELSKALDAYVFVENDDEIKDAETRVKKCAAKYFNAHFPVTSEGAKPGPIDTLDPTYVDYILLCRKYGIPIGTLLHEADI